MKKFIYILLFFMTFISFELNAQTIVENKVDEFKGHSIKRTSWEVLNMSNRSIVYHRISKINENEFVDLLIQLGGSVFAIGKDDEVMFKLDNGEVVSLYNLEYTVSCRGCGAKGLLGADNHGVKISCILPEDIKEKLKNNNVVKIWIYTTDGYVEYDIKEKNNLMFKKALHFF